MVDQEDIQKLFKSLYGVDVDLKQVKVQAPPAEDHAKLFFIRSIAEWRNAFLVQGSLDSKFGIDLSGYDKQLYDSLESIYYSFLGPIKASIIINYVYCPINLEVESFRIIDKYGKQFPIKTIEDLYYFIINCKDQDFLKEE
jgi:hypothetical protein